MPSAKQLAATLGNLPAPDEALLAHSQRLTEVIRREIESHGGSIPFSRYMELALYAPGLGYYSAGLRKFGPNGDFVTAPEMSPLFSHCVARQCDEVLQHLGGGAICEFGAGSGALAVEVLLELERLDGLPAAYFIMEVSADLRQRQKELLTARVPHLMSSVDWLDQLPTSGFCGVVIANEVLDAMPVQRFALHDGKIYESSVRWQDDGFVWQEHAVVDGDLVARVRQLRAELGDDALPEPYVSEVNVVGEAWTQQLCAMLERGVALLLDYGFPRREFFHADRTTGTLMCHYQHRSHNNPLILTGLQDITAHVEFTAIAEAALSAGADVLGYTTQAQFLLATGLLEEMAALPQDDARSYIEAANQVKKLTLPNEMGELFKVMALGKDVDLSLRGFALRDYRGKL